MCEEMQLHSRRQKALKLEFASRIERLEHLRAVRLANIRALKEQAAAVALAKEEAKKPKGKSFGQKFKEFSRKAIRGAKDYIRDLIHENATRMDEEELRMAHSLTSKSRTGTSGNRAEGIRRFHFTNSVEEEETFQTIQKVQI